MKAAYYIGIMSGTSLDGIDAVLADFEASRPVLLDNFYLPYPGKLREQLKELHFPGQDELHRAAMLGNQLACHYAEAVGGLLRKSGIAPNEVAAIGCHGQTVRHCPQAEAGYTIQLCNSPLLVELTGIRVVSDFRSRDIAAGGQGAPLVPAFHQALFADPHVHRVIVNIGGISNLTDLPRSGNVTGFDCGPGNAMMDEWCARHTGQAYDEDGRWAATGKAIPLLLEKLLTLPFFSLPPPKSVSRELFNTTWLDGYLEGEESPADVQATLLELTVTGIARCILDYCGNAAEIYVCGGGARNSHLVASLQVALSSRKVGLTDRLGVDADWLEAFAFAWLARQVIHGMPGNIPSVTGAKGERLLGAIYPAY